MAKSEEGLRWHGSPNNRSMKTSTKMHLVRRFFSKTWTIKAAEDNLSCRKLRLETNVKDLLSKANQHFKFEGVADWKSFAKNMFARNALIFGQMVRRIDISLKKLFVVGTVEEEENLIYDRLMKSGWLLGVLLLMYILRNAISIEN